MRRALLKALILALPLAACVKNPPLLKPTEVQAPEIPTVAAAPDPMTLGWVRAHQLVRLAERLGVENPTAMASAAGVDLAPIDPERPFVLLFGEPTGTETPGALAWAPVAPDSGIAMILAGASPSGTIPMAGGVAIPLLGATGADTKTKLLLEKLINAPIAMDLEIFVQLHALVKNWGPQIEAGLVSMQGALKNLPGPGPKPQPAVIDTYLGWARDALARAGTVLIGFAAGADDVTLQYVSQDKTAMSTAWPARASSMPDLAQFLPTGAVRLELVMTQDTKMMEFALKLYDELLKDLPAQRDRLRRDLEAWQKGEVQMAMSMSFGGDRLFRAAGLSQTDQAEALFASMVDMAHLVAEPEVGHALTQDMISLNVKVEEGVREIEGRSVARVTYTLGFGPKMKEEAKSPALVAMLDKPMVMEMVRLGSYLLYTLNEAPGTLDTLAAELLGGKGSQPSLLSRSREPAGGYFYMDTDLAGLMNGVISLLPAEPLQSVPQVDPKTPLVTAFAYGPGPLNFVRMTLPQVALQNLRRFGEQLGASRHAARN